ncbi:MAG: hypothetical protein AAFW68_08835 [Pseudomonadota bacterium]
MVMRRFSTGLCIFAFGGMLLTSAGAETSCRGGRCTVSAVSNGRHAEDVRWLPLLQAFDFEFTGNDRPPREFAVGSQGPGSAASATSRRFALDLLDGDGNDRLRASARFAYYSESWRALRGIRDPAIGVERTVSRRGCRSSCWLDIPDYERTNTRLVLTGFRFRYPGGENHLREVTIWPDFRRSLRATFKDDDGAENFDVSVSYVLMPMDWFDHSLIPYTNVVDGPAETIRLPLYWADNVAVMGGFSFRYADGDEHIKRLRVDTDSQNVRFHLQDNNAGNKVSFEAVIYGLCRSQRGGDNVLYAACD